MSIQPSLSIQSTDSPTIYTETKTRQAAAKDIQRSYRSLKRPSSYKDESLTQTYLMLDRALSEAQSQKELCKNNNQTVNDDSTYISNDEEEDDEELDNRSQERSRCGLNECMHELLMDSGKFFYECFGKPRDKDTAENIVTAAEFGEESAAMFCCVKS